VADEGGFPDKLREGEARMAHASVFGPGTPSPPTETRIQCHGIVRKSKDLVPVVLSTS
jgi:hypothetical protein